MRPLIEVCVESVEAAKIALEAGADRLELNSQLRLDGLTPTPKECEEVRRLCAIPLVAMLRPHAQGFIYDRETQKMIFRELDGLLSAGVDGIVFGALSAEKAIDIQLMRAVRARCEGVELVMHRAFDQVDDQQRELCVLVELGVDRVLTSGGMPTAEAGVAQLRKLIEWSRDRIEILPGGGVRSENAQHILRITGCQQLHGTFKQIGHQPIVPDASEIARLKQLRIDTGKA